MAFKYLIVTRSNKTAVVKINRPPVNAFNTELVIELAECFIDLNTDDNVYSVIITGEGKAFVAGADIKEMESMTAEQAEEFSSRGQNTMNIISNLLKPVIAAINGFALGGGCELALACDIRFAVPGAKLGQPEVKLGVVPGFGGTQRLPRLIGKGMASDLIFSGRTVDAEDALKIGLIDRIISPPEDLLAKAQELADEIGKNGLCAVSESKKLINNGLNVPLKDGLAMEKMSFSRHFGTRDQKEGMGAFLAKREPKFENKLLDTDNDKNEN